MTINFQKYCVITFVLVLSLIGLAHTQDSSTQDNMQNCPMHKEHAAASHHLIVEGHGDQAMGFSHDKTTHHFRMSANGGAIEVTTNDPNDKVNSDAIHSHLMHIAVMFGDGNFSTPMFVHDGIPPGIATMTLLRTKIRYKYETMMSGGRVLIESDDPVAVAAIHDFLRFQISDHQTGDSLVIGHEN